MIWSIITAFGTLASLVGVAIALRQISKTRKAAEAAAAAANDARTAIRQSLFLVDLGAAVRHVNEIRGQLRAARIDAACLRAGDLAQDLVEIRSRYVEWSAELGPLVDRSALLRDQLEDNLNGGPAVNPAKAARVLASVSDTLHGLMARSSLPSVEGA